MAATTTGALSAKPASFYRKEFLTMEKDIMVVPRFGESYDLPKYNTKILTMYRYDRLPLITTALDSTEAFSQGSAQSITRQAVIATIGQWGAHAQVSVMAALTDVDPELRTVNQLHADQAARSQNADIWKEVVRSGAYCMRADADATYELDGVIDGTGTTSTFTDATLSSSTANWWAGMHAECYSGTNKGWAGMISACSTVGVTTVAPVAPAAFDVTSYMHYCSGRTMAATDTLTTTNIAKAYAVAQNHLTMPFQGGYAGIYHPFVKNDLLKDTTFVTAVSYGDLAQLRTGADKNWFGINWHVDTTVYRETSVGTWDSGAGTSGTFAIPIIGQKSFGVLKLGNEGLNIYVLDKPDKVDIHHLYNLFVWNQFWTSKSTNANWTHVILCGATGVTVD